MLASIKIALCYASYIFLHRPRVGIGVLVDLFNGCLNFCFFSGSAAVTEREFISSISSSFASGYLLTSDLETMQPFPAEADLFHLVVDPTALALP